MGGGARFGDVLVSGAGSGVHKGLALPWGGFWGAVLFWEDFEGLAVPRRTRRWPSAMPRRLVVPWEGS